MTNEQRAEFLWRGLSAALRRDRDLTMTTVSYWLNYHGAGGPLVPMDQERVRGDAQLWAAAATQPELEAYLAAAVLELEGSTVAPRAVKRLAALAWRHMGAEDRAKFREWIKNQ
jgi:hypothetical protein